MGTNLTVEHTFHIEQGFVEDMLVAITLVEFFQQTHGVLDKPNTVVLREQPR